MCGNERLERFIYHDDIYHIPSLTEKEVTMIDAHSGSVQLNGPLKVIRSKVVTCVDCGYILFFDTGVKKG